MVIYPSCTKMYGQQNIKKISHILLCFIINYVHHPHSWYASYVLMGCEMFLHFQAVTRFSILEATAALLRRC